MWWTSSSMPCQRTSCESAAAPAQLALPWLLLRLRATAAALDGCARGLPAAAAAGYLSITAFTTATCRPAAMVISYCPCRSAFAPAAAEPLPTEGQPHATAAAAPPPPPAVTAVLGREFNWMSTDGGFSWANSTAAQHFSSVIHHFPKQCAGQVCTRLTSVGAFTSASNESYWATDSSHTFSLSPSAPHYVLAQRNPGVVVRLVIITTQQPTRVRCHHHFSRVVHICHDLSAM
jgi:hypothetical protein